jgi:hypothetical protein
LYSEMVRRIAAGGVGPALMGTVACVGLLLGCRTDPPLANSAPAPKIVSATVSPNPNSVLSALVSFITEQADSARVVYRGVGLENHSTPFQRVGGIDTIPVLGLRPSTAYRMVIEVAGPGGRVSSDSLTFSAGALPEGLTRVAIVTSGSSGPGVTLTSLVVPGAGLFALAFDSAGVIRWYRRFESADRFPGELKRQANGNFTLYRGGSTGVERVPGHYVEFNPAGDSVRSITVSLPRYLDNHDLWITRGADGTERFHFFTYDHRPSDLRPIGGANGVLLAGHQLVRLRSDGSTEFEWNAWDHLSFEEWIEARPGPDDFFGRDFDHPNSLAFDRDGNYIVSFRQLAQVMKIDAETGDILWRLGGVKSDFSFPDDPLGGFSAQHSATILADGNLLLYDNGTSHQPQESRAVEYALDLTNRTARLVWQFRHQPPLYTAAVGSVQRLENGNTLVGYGWIGRASEVGRDGAVQWAAELRVDGEAALAYRLVRLASLYQ